MRMRWMAAVLLAGLMMPAAAARAEGPFSDMSFEDALKAAAKDKKVVFVDFYTTWCGPCKMLDRMTWPDENVSKWLKANTIALKVDAEKQRPLAQKYGVRAYPTMVFISPDGNAMGRLVGFMPPAQFLEKAGALVGGKSIAEQAAEEFKGKENDPMARMNYARTLAREGQHKEALAHFMWCFDEGEQHGIGFGGVRVSFLLNEIVSLGRDYPAAIDALKERRDKARARIDEILKNGRPAKAGGMFAFLKPGGDPLAEAIGEFAAINGHVGDDANSLALYDALEGAKGDEATDARMMLARRVFDALLDAKRYDDIVRDMDPRRDPIDEEIQMFRDMTAQVEKDKRVQDSIPHFRTMTVRDCGKYYEAMLGAGKSEAAAEAMEKVVAFDKSPETFVTLMRHARRAGSATAEEALRALARERLSDSEFARFGELVKAVG